MVDDPAGQNHYVLVAVMKLFEKIIDQPSEQTCCPKVIMMYEIKRGMIEHPALGASPSLSLNLSDEM
jgi:hypothetical protein